MTKPDRRAFDCDECGEVHPKGCHRHVFVRDDDGRIVVDADTGRAIIDHACRQPARKDQEVCRMHGGSAPQNVAAAERRGTERAAREALERLGPLEYTAVDDPLSELADYAGRAKAWMLRIDEKVANLTGLKARYVEAGATSQADRIHAEVVLLERASAEFRTTLVAMARLNIDERLANIHQAQFDLVSSALTAALRDHGLDTSEQRAVVTSLGHHLRAVAG